MHAQIAGPAAGMDTVEVEEFFTSTPQEILAEFPTTAEVNEDTGVQTNFDAAKSAALALTLLRLMAAPKVGGESGVRHQRSPPDR